MNCYKDLKVFLVILFAILPSRICDDEVCSSETTGKACSCVFPNGTGIDITPLGNSTFLSSKIFNGKINASELQLSEYFFHPCSDLKFSDSPDNNTLKCGTPLSICRHVQTMTLQNSTIDILYKSDGGSYETMGEAQHATFSPSGTFITYTNGPSQTIVYLVCVQTEDHLLVKSQDDPRSIELTFYSKNACLRQIKAEGRSIGSTLCIIFFSFVIFYLVLGICAKKFLMGATGIEVIPNLAFWSDLPSLMREGWAFALNGFKLPARGAGPPVPPNPNSYDSI